MPLLVQARPVQARLVEAGWGGAVPGMGQAEPDTKG